MSRVPTSGRVAQTGRTAVSGRGAGSGRLDITPWVPPVTSGLVWLYEPIFVNIERDSTTGKVRRILDSSGQGNHTQTQTDTNAQPTWVSTGISGRPSIGLDGVGQFLLSPAISISQPLTVFVIHSLTVSQSVRIFYDSQTSVGRHAYFTISATQVDHYYEDPSPRQIVANRTVSATGELVVAVYHLSSSTLRINGVQTNAAYTATVITTSVGMIFGCRFTRTVFWGGQSSLIILYNRALSDSEILQVETAIRLRWPVY